MEIINEYFIEIIAGVAIAALIIIYMLLKKSEEKTYIEPTDKVKLKPVNLTSEKVEEITKAEENNELIHKENEAVTTNRKKRESVPHNKITKDDFSIFKGVKILVAEDNIINQKVIVGLLSGSGIEITIANDGQEALNILENNADFSLILMDAHMPIVDGFQATRLIRKNQRYNDIPIIALSGDTASDDIKNMMNVGMEAHLEKPLRMDAFYDILYIYTTGNESENHSKKSFDEAAEFDIEVGLDICGGDKEFYLEILNDFMSKYSDSAKKLQDYINRAESVEADKMLLDISGVAANIGAEHLHQIALKLKNSIAHPNDLEYITNLKMYKRSLAQVCEAIEEYARTK
jgi:CheY-like chemotaxis protein